MKPFVPFEIVVCGIDELEGFCAVGVTHVLSLLDPGWPSPGAFDAYGEHRRLDLRFHDIIDDLPGWRAPGADDIEQLLDFGRGLPAANAHLLVHCQMGISRSSAAMILLLAQARPDRPAIEALREVVRIRPHAWPNLRIMELGDRILDRRGELVDAAVTRYREVVDKRPELGRTMREMGRIREVERAAAR
jgi:predicted protein tyrosine phosphatase